MIYDNLITEYADIFNKLKEEGKDYYCFLRLGVPLKILSELYTKFIKDGIAPLESLDSDTKNKYWDIAKKYQETLTNRIKASQAAYVLTLITSTE